MRKKRTPVQVQDRVENIFQGLAGDRNHLLKGGVSAAPVIEIISSALSAEYPIAIARDIAFHCSDWNSDAAFVVALHLFPEKFTRDEVKAGITNLLIHAPNHLAAAAKLAGWPIEDVFKVGALEGE